MLPAETLEAIKSLLGPQGWLTAEDAQDYVSDINGPAGQSLLVARPNSVEQISELVRICAKQGIALVPQGGNTNLCRMAVPVDNRHTILLSLNRLNKIIEVIEPAGVVIAEAGCVIQTVQEAYLEKNLVFAPDWGARGTATVGGAVSTNGGGLNVLRYGTTREQVLGIEAVLPDGTIWNGLRRLIKDNSGYDLKHLFIGAEGTLGIITKIAFKLHPAKPHTRTLMASINELEHIMPLLNKVRKIAHEQLSAFELLPGIGVELALSRYPDLKRPLQKSDWYVLIRLSSVDEVSPLLEQIFEAGFEAGLIVDAVVPQSDVQERNIWEIREQMIPHQYFQGQKMLKWDVSVPFDKMPEFLLKADARVKALAPEAICYAVGHVGDGNVHYSAFLKKENGAEHKFSDILDAVDDLVWGLGGSVTAEHGVGALFIDRIQGQKNAVEYALMQKIKSALDPQNVMNPGKLLKP